MAKAGGADAADEAARLKGLAAFGPIFAAPDFSFGEIGRSGYFYHSDTVRDFTSYCSSDAWCTNTINWTEWHKTEEAKRLMTPEVIEAEATAHNLAQILTTLIRVERFAEGSMRKAHKLGIFDAIFRRAQALLDETG